MTLAFSHRSVVDRISLMLFSSLAMFCGVVGVVNLTFSRLSFKEQLGYTTLLLLCPLCMSVAATIYNESNPRELRWSWTAVAISMLLFAGHLANAFYNGYI